MSFMLYVPYYTLFVQENTSKDQEINQNANSACVSDHNLLKRASSREHKVSLLKRAQHDKAAWQLLNCQQKIFQSLT